VSAGQTGSQRSPGAHTCQAALRAPLALLLLAGLAVALADEPVQQAPRTNDFPTIERVLFVEACARDHPDRARTEMLYKCSCVIDVVASRLTFDEYVDAATAFNAGQAAGERGARIRESSTGRELTERFRSVQSQAVKQCMLQP
jgi:hypothetical protein